MTGTRAGRGKEDKVSKRVEKKPSTECIIDVQLDEKTVTRRSPDVEHERAVAIYDLLEHNYFAPVEATDGGRGGPYTLHLSISENRLLFDVRDAKDQPLRTLFLSLAPFRKVVKDYFTICESYYEAIKTASPSRIEAIDMGRRGLHNEGSQILRDRLAGKVEIDEDTARRLFTLICVLHIKG
jgi:uncharacterized protein (UPF0262 family)